MTTVRLFLLANFDEEEQDAIRQYISNGRDDVEVELYPWDQEEDGGEGSLQEAYKTDPATVMFFMDREGFDNQSYIVADGRCIQQRWYCEMVLNYYGIEYSDNDWVFNDDAVQIFENHAVPWTRFDASGDPDIADTQGYYDADEEYSILNSFDEPGDVMTISFSQDDYDDVRNQILALNPEDVVEEDDEGGEEGEEDEEAEEEEE